MKWLNCDLCKKYIFLVFLILIQSIYPLAKNSIRVSNKSKFLKIEPLIKDRVFLSLEHKNIYDKYNDLIMSEVKELYDKNNFDPFSMSFNQFNETFQQGNFAAITKSYINNSTIVQKYYSFFKLDGEMDLYSFKAFYFYHFLEGELLVAGLHPLLSSKYPNKGKMNQEAYEFWKIIIDIVEQIYLQKNLDRRTEINRKSIFRLFVELKDEFDNDIFKEQIQDYLLEFYEFFLSFSENKNSILKKDFYLYYVAYLYFKSNMLELIKGL